MIIKMNEKVCFKCFLDALSDKVDDKSYLAIKFLWESLRNAGSSAQLAFEITNDMTSIMTWRNSFKTIKLKLKHENDWVVNYLIIDHDNNQYSDGDFLLYNINKQVWLIELLKDFK